MRGSALLSPDFAVPAALRSSCKGLFSPVDPDQEEPSSSLNLPGQRDESLRHVLPKSGIRQPFGQGLLAPELLALPGDDGAFCPPKPWFGWTWRPEP